MKERFSERPKAFWLEVLNAALGAMCVVHFTENVSQVEEPGEDGEIRVEFEADHYTVETGYREGLEEAVRENTAEWLAAAKQRETETQNKTLKTRVKELEQTAREQDETIRTQDEVINDILAAMLEV